MKIPNLLLIFVLILAPHFAQSEAGQARYFFSGDGKLLIQGKREPLKLLSPRLVALLDYLQESLGSGKNKIQILSGYRSPTYNEQLRQKGKLAGKASLHLEGMAVDFVLQGVNPQTIRDFIKKLDCCGVGFYHGTAIHLDTGPPRFWDEKTSKVFTDISDHNKLIWLSTEFDIYKPGETLNFNLVRITEYPFGIQNEVILETQNGEKKIKLTGKPDCTVITNRDEAQKISLSLPDEKKLEDKPLKIRLAFCQKPSDAMPDTMLSNTFIIASPK